MEILSKLVNFSLSNRIVFCVFLEILIFLISVVFAITPFELIIKDSLQFVNSLNDYVYIRGKYFHRNDSHKFYERRRKAEESGESQPDTKLTSASWFSQCVDHFSDGNSEYLVNVNESNCPENKFWNQRFWVNSKYYKSQGPIFFMFGGEGSAEGFVDYGKWQTYAKKYGALLTCLEHRFYGQSFPTINTSHQDMLLLTSQQALADAALFIQWLKSSEMFTGFNLTNAKLVAFGGSYPGNLAAWMRQKYPSLVNVAIASSAPLKGLLNFTQFYRTVSQVILELDPICYQKIFDTFHCIESIVDGASCNSSRYTSKQEMASALHQCHPSDFSVDWERQMFFYNLGSKWGSNFPGHTSASKCINLLGHERGSDVIDNYGSFLVNSGQASQDGCQRRKGKAKNHDSHSASNKMLLTDEIIEFLSSLEGQARDAKSWIWQTCYEFGYFQASDPKLQLFTNQWNTLIDVKRSQHIFPDSNFTEENIKTQIEFTNSFYGEKSYNGTCAVFINGGWDPWHELGLNSQNETFSKNTVISIPQSEHCEDMKEISSPSKHMYKAQRKIMRQIGKYLVDPTCSSTS